MKGQAPLVNTAFEFKLDCSVTSNRGGGTFDARNIKLIEEEPTRADPLGHVRDLVLTYYPGDTSESFTVTCEDQPPYTAPASPPWTGASRGPAVGELLQKALSSSHTTIDLRE